MKLGEIVIAKLDTWTNLNIYAEFDGQAYFSYFRVEISCQICPKIQKS